MADWDPWYLNANPGPYYPCLTQSGTPPTFDNDQGSAATPNVAKRNNSIATVQDLTPSSSYTCVGSAGALSWNATTKVLTANGTIFIAGNTSSFGAGSTQTIEPRLFYVYVPYRDQNAIPLFDTGLADFNYPQLFTENRFVGGDRFGDANQATLALTSRILQADGQEAIRATVGQTFRPLRGLSVLARQDRSPARQSPDATAQSSCTSSQWRADRHALNFEA